MNGPQTGRIPGGGGQQVRSVRDARDQRPADQSGGLKPVERTGEACAGGVETVDVLGPIVSGEGDLNILERHERSTNPGCSGR